MHIIHDVAIIPKPCKEVWQIAIDIPNYPEFVYFLKKTSLLTPVRLGGEWLDTVTTFYGIPMTYHHTISKMEEEKVIAYAIILPFGGKMHQEFTLKKETETTTQMAIQVTYSFPNKFIDKTVGSLLKSRLQVMIQQTLVQISFYNPPLL